MLVKGSQRTPPKGRQTRISLDPKEKRRPFFNVIASAGEKIGNWKPKRRGMELANGREKRPKLT